MRKILKMIVKTGLIMAVSLAIASVLQTTVKAANPTSATAKVMVTGSEKISRFKTYTVSYTKSDLITIGGKQYYGAIVEIKTPNYNGSLYIDFPGSPIVSAPTEINVYSDKACTSELRFSQRRFYESSSIEQIQAPCPIGSTSYYLAFYTETYHADKLATNKFSFKCYYYSGASHVLENNKWLVCAKRDNIWRNYEITLKKAGHIIIESDRDISIKISRSLDDYIYRENSLDSYNKRKASYYLEKGTYTINTLGTYSGVHRIRYTYYKPGTSKFKAVSGKTFTVYPGTSSAYQYVQYKAKVNGYVTLTQPNKKLAYITLCDSKHRPLSSEDKLYGKRSASKCLTYGVKKGKTYYIRIRSTWTLLNISVKETAVKEKSGATKKKAISIKSGKTVKGTIQTGSKAIDWYKLKITKAKKVYIAVKGSSNNAIHIDIYDSKGEKIFYRGSDFYGYGYNGFISMNKLSKGTYYIGVSGTNAGSSGYYTLKWK